MRTATIQRDAETGGFVEIRVPTLFTTIVYSGSSILPFKVKVGGDPFLFRERSGSIGIKMKYHISGAVRFVLLVIFFGAQVSLNARGLGEDAIKQITYKNFLIARGELSKANGNAPVISGGKIVIDFGEGRVLTDKDIGLLVRYLVAKKKIRVEVLFPKLVSKEILSRCVAGHAFEARFGEKGGVFIYHLDPPSKENEGVIEYWRRCITPS